MIGKWITPLVAAAAFQILASPAIAQDRAERDVTPWSGPYFGVSLGFGEAEILSPSGDRTTLDGRVPTIHSGYAITRGNTVFGFEWDLAINLGRDTVFGPKVEIDGVETGVDWFATLRGRYGQIVNDSTLLYVTGGAAYSDTVSSDRSYALGAVYGGGVEQALNPHWTVRGEVMFMDFGEGDDTIAQTDTTWHVQVGLTRHW